jgi:hypothetical protein
MRYLWQCQALLRVTAARLQGIAMRLIALTAAALFGWTSAAAAQSPTAIVESTNGQVSGADFMEYVIPGHVIKLGANGSVVLAYLTSCMRETISGGVVIVGNDESRVSLGEVSREKTNCDPAQAQVPVNASSGGGMVFRGRPEQQPAAPLPRVTIFSLTPLIDVGDAGKLTIERTDKPGEVHEAMLSKTALVKQKFYDLAAAKLELKPGGVYLATFGSRKMLFKVDQLATAGGPLPGRLLRL